jgi:hypothetical protein
MHGSLFTQARGRHAGKWREHTPQLAAGGCAAMLGIITPIVIAFDSTRLGGNIARYGNHTEMGYSTALVAGRTVRSCRRRCARPSRARSRGPPSAPPRPGAAGRPRQAPRSCVRDQHGFALLTCARNALVEDPPTVHPLASPLVPALVERLQLVGGQRFRARPKGS